MGGEPTHRYSLRSCSNTAAKPSRKRRASSYSTLSASAKRLRCVTQYKPFGKGSLIRRLLDRQLCTGVNSSNIRNHALDKFKKIKLISDLDTHDPLSLPTPVLSFFHDRAKIVEIVATGEFIFGLTGTGTNKRVCFLNITCEEVIRSLFYNRTNDSLITVSVYKHDNYSSLKCRSTTLSQISKGKPGKGINLFETECLNWPGFVEFDDVNSKVLTYSAQNNAYKVWDLQDYSEIYAIRDPNIEEIKISPGIMLLIYNRAKNGSFIPLTIVNIMTGRSLKKWKHKLIPGKKIEFIEQFNEKLLVKQSTEKLQIIDVRTTDILYIDEKVFVTPSAFIFLYEYRLFLTFREGKIAVWNFRGELVSTFDDHELWHKNCNTNNIYITNKQDLIISYCKRKKGRTGGSINISEILNGRCIAKIECKEGDPVSCHALQNVTALHYNEKDNEIYTGTDDGHIHIWTN